MSRFQQPEKLENRKNRRFLCKISTINFVLVKKYSIPLPRQAGAEVKFDFVQSRRPVAPPLSSQGDRWQLNEHADLKSWAGQYFLGLSRTGDGIGFFLSFSTRPRAHGPTVGSLNLEGLSGCSLKGQESLYFLMFFLIFRRLYLMFICHESFQIQVVTKSTSRHRVRRVKT